eukprot:c2620_g1_i1.p1 GENE.c2620_g1_i1~~c2620_g1_i1.p1  ORF type:complete len:107 (+),score=41.52 c2620_g1_i1:3-323(+)
MSLNNFASQEKEGFILNENNYPNDEMQEKFFKSYLSVYDPSLNDSSELETIINQMKKEVWLYARLSHAQWCVRAIIKRQETTIKWGYYEYAQQRLTAFYNMGQKEF